MTSSEGRFPNPHPQAVSFLETSRSAIGSQTAAGFNGKGIRGLFMLFCEQRKRLYHDGHCVIHAVDTGDVLDIAADLGRPQPDPRDGVLLKDIRPQPRHTANTNTLSSRYGMGAFPVHTEAAYLRKPPRFLLLYCIEPGCGGRTTVLLDGAAISSRLPEVRRPGTWVVKAGRRPFLCDVLWRRAQNQVGIRYDRECLFPCGPAALAEEQLIRSFVEASTPVTIEWARGQLLVIDNHRVLHGRGGSKHDDKDRWLKRVLVGEE
jgi:L-asparagine oxygenase